MREGSVYRLVSFMGTGNYAETKYVWSDQTGEPVETRFVTYALAKILKPSEVICLGTTQAQDKWRRELEQAFEKSGMPEPRFEEIPLGVTSAQLWDIFEVCRQALVPKDPNEAVVLDVTHGFRTQPLIAAAAASFLRLTLPPNENQAEAITLAYGSWEGRDLTTNIAPVLDVTPFLDIVDWAQAIMMFLRTGRVGDLAELTRDAARQAGRAWSEGGKEGPPPGLAKLYDPLLAFGLDLATVRTGALFLSDGNSGGSARRLVDIIDSILPGLDKDQDQKALASVIGDLRAMAADLVLPQGIDTLADPRAKQAVVNLADRYLAMERYSEAASTAREGMVSQFAVPAAGQPGRRFDSAARKNAETAWFDSMQDEARRDAQIRNDLAHAGFNNSPMRGQKVKSQIEGLVARFAAMDVPDPASPLDRTNPVFVNISNHKLEDWPPEQTAAAQALAPTLRELPFPTVDPDADEEAVTVLVESIVADVPPNTTHAMVQGEFTLTFALVRRLQARGIICLAATTHRDVISEPDGSRRYRFRFRRFRCYGDLP